MRWFLALLLFLYGGLFALSAAELMTEDVNEDGEPDRWIEESGNGYTFIRSDRNFDGVIDHVLKIDAAGNKVYEEMDFNLDGIMDDFSYYSRGVLERREIDTNFDTRIDLWITMYEGVYIMKVVRDTDFDGEPDKIIDYANR